MYVLTLFATLLQAPDIPRNFQADLLLVAPSDMTATTSNLMASSLTMQLRIIFASTFPGAEVCVANDPIGCVC